MSNETPLIDGMFAEWHFGPYRVTRGPFCLWVANGFLSFGDNDHGAPFLRGYGVWTRWLIWREFKREVRRRAAAQVRSDRDAGLAKLIAGEAKP